MESENIINELKYISENIINKSVIVVSRIFFQNLEFVEYSCANFNEAILFGA